MPVVKLPIPLDMEPMLSAPGEGIPRGDSWEYEPKWDGFRTLVFRDGDKVELISRGARPMTRYFPTAAGQGNGAPGGVPLSTVVDRSPAGMELGVMAWCRSN